MIPVFLALFSCVSFLAAQEVLPEQKVLITKVTASWCSNCGQWGWDLFEGLVKDNEQDAILIAAHSSGDLQTAHAAAIADNFNSFGQPLFFVGNENQSANRGNIDSKRETIKTMVAESKNQTPIANTAAITSFENGVLKATVKTKFFQQTFGDYYVATYLIENGVLNSQSGRGSEVEHKKVMRGGMMTEDFGKRMINGMVMMNREFTETFEMAISEGWNVENMELVTIIWKKSEEEYHFVNTNAQPAISETTTPIQTLTKTGVRMEVNSLQDFSAVNIQILTDTPWNGVNLFLTDVNGRNVGVLHRGTLNQGLNQFQFDKTQLTAGGIYFVSLAIGGELATEKIYLR